MTPTLDIRIQTADFDLRVELDRIRTALPGQIGAVASFVGLVRDQRPPVDHAALGVDPSAADPGTDAIDELLLEHYPGMTERSMLAMAESAAERWALKSITAVHRVGSLKPSDQIVLVVVASSHRPEAFAACEYLMDYLKTDAIIWKRERTRRGTRWLEPTSSDRDRREKWSSH
ncbi:MAG: molybdenum cofactor biosynthesis protein MoaE [Pseudomonadota bacterium]